jgi:signal transduction histidine kinase
LPILLLLASGMIVAVLAYLLWQSAVMERDLRVAELERARSQTERILQRAPGSRAAFAAVPAELRVAVQPDGVPEFADVGWLVQQASPIDEDLVVDDRLERATRAEFVDRDGMAAQRGFDELLAAPLVATTRLRAVAVAAWQARRAGANERLATLRQELDEKLAALAPADLGRPAIAQAVSASLRLAAGGPSPGWAAKLAPFLPPELFASLPDQAPWTAAHDALVRRRARLNTIAQAFAARSVRAPSDLIAADATRLLWWLPREGGGDAALLTPHQWCDCVLEAGRAGALPEWPVPFSLLVAEDTRASFGGIPGLHDCFADVPPPEVWPRAALIGGLLAVLALAVMLAVVAQLRAARAQVTAVRTQSEFLTTVTHELKTPLASIRLLGEMLAEGRAKGREADYYSMLAGEAGRLSMLIENVLDLGRLERGERAYDLRAVDVGEVVGETLAMFAPLMERDGGKVVWDDLCGSVLVRVDRGALVQALVAVLDNARKYGGTDSRIDVVTRRDGGRLAIAVQDHGPGVPAAERERIFERFVRGEAHAHGSTPGVGIGLYLARSIARRLHGDLVCAEPLDGGPGACFTFFLALENPA